MLKNYIKEEHDKGLGIYKVWLEIFNVYDEGETREEAVEDLTDSLIEYCDIYTDQIDKFSKVTNKEQQELIPLISKYRSDRSKLKKMLGL